MANSDARLRRKLERRLRELNIRLPQPFTADGFCRNVAEARGREIHLIEWDTSAAATPCGLWISTQQAEYIIYERTAARILQEHIILHELSHLLLGHAGAVQVPDVLEQFEMLDSAVVERVLGRTSVYDANEEREAEVLASIIGEHTNRIAQAVPRQLDKADAAVLDRFSAALAGDQGWP